MRVVPTGNALSLFLLITFTLCILWGLATPASMHMHQAWEPLLPGFRFISFPSFLIGAVETYAYGWYAALVFVPLYNLFNRSGAVVAQKKETSGPALRSCCSE